MSANIFKFDVAFSFLAQDESLALKLNNLLKRNVSTFIYTENQKILAGRDGEEIFNRVFAVESRIVVVFYRDNWGKSPWTKIEETAIRNRAFNTGYDFVTFIPMDEPVNPPAWLPKNRLWIGLKRWGIDHAASVIESRVQEYGGDIKIETLADKVQKAQDEIAQSQKRARLLSSYEGMPYVEKQYNDLINAFKSKINEVKQIHNEWNLQLKEGADKHLTQICSFGYTLIIRHYPQNYPQSTYTVISFNHGVYDINGQQINPQSDYQNLGHEKLKFDINNHDEHGWCDRESGRNFRKVDQIVDVWLTKFFMKIKDHRLSQNF